MSEQIKFHVDSKKRTIIVQLRHKRLSYATKEFKGVWHCDFVLCASDLTSIYLTQLEANLSDDSTPVTIVADGYLRVGKLG